MGGTNSSSTLSTVLESDYDSIIHDEEDTPPRVIGSYPSYSMSPMECLLVFLLFLFWFYALRRFYVVWSNVLNFSAIQTDSLSHGRGWDAFFQWAMEHFRSIRHARQQNDNETTCQRMSMIKSNSISCEQGGLETQDVVEVVTIKGSSVITIADAERITSEV